MAQPPKFEADASNDTHQDSPPPPTSEPAPASSGEQAAEPADAGSAGPENDPEIETFAQMGVPPPLLDAVSAMGWERPTKVQTSTFEPVSQGRDVIVQSQTGSGKTGAFCLPWLAARFEDAPASQTGVQLLVLTPTRELAKQVCGQLVELGKDTNVTPLPVYGGTAMQPQLQALKQGVHAVVGTPGRILDHIRRRTLKLNAVQMVVLDEADEMLSMGFLEDIHAILDACPKERQTTLFSATVPPDIERIARRYMQDPVTIKLSGDQVAAAEIGHAYYTVSGTLRTRDLVDVIALEEPPTGLIFCNTREETNFVASVLRREGFSAEALSSDLTQVARERVLGWMRSGKLRFLVATDVASRGIDISHISHVINYTFPQNAESYVHRTGRTGRAGRAGQALSLISAQELGNFYYLKLQYPSIEFEERKLPPASELEAQRIENKLDLISARFPELVSPEWALLARHLVKDPRGEQVVAYLLSEAMSRTEEPKEAPDEELREAREMRRGRHDRDSDRRRDRDGDRRRDRDDERPRGRGRTRDRRRRESDDGRVRADRATEEHREERTDADPAERFEQTPSSDHVQQADPEARTARRRRRRNGRDADRDEVAPDEVAPDEGDRNQVDRDHGADADGTQAASEAAAEPSAASDGEPSATAAASTDDAAADGDSGRRRRRRRRRGRGKDRGSDQDESGAETKDAQPRHEVTDQPVVAAPLPTPLPTEPAGASEAAQGDDETVELPEEGADLVVDEARTEPLETADAGDTTDGPRKRRRRRRRRRRGKTDGEAQPDKRAAAGKDKGDDKESSDSAEGEGGKKRRRRRRKSRRKGSSEQAAQPSHVSQDQIIIDIDEEELEVVRDQFGEIDELDDLTLKGRRRGVMDALQDEVELEDMSKRDVSSDDDSSDDDSSDDSEESASESDEDEANGQAAEAPTDDRELKKKKRRRRRRKKKPEEAPAPELTAPPHKDFWEVWASKFSFKDFEDDKYADEPDDDTPSDDVLEAVAAQALSAAQFENDEDDASFVTVLLSVGRQHGKKSAHIRELLANDFQLTGKAVRDLTVTDGHTKFRISQASYERLSQGMPGYVFDGVELELTLVEPAPGEATSQDNEVEGGPSPASNEDAGSAESVQPT